MALVVDIQKASMPIIWVDTSILFIMARLRAGRSVQEDQAQRIQRLYDLLYKAVREKKVICPETEQREECLGDRSAFRDTSLGLSLGIRSKAYYEIEEYQCRNHIDAYCAEADSISMSYHEAFFEDPVDIIERQEPLIIDRDIGRLEFDESFIESRNRLVEKLESLRQNLRERDVSFEDQLENEKNGENEGVSTALRVFDNDEASLTYDHICILQTYYDRIAYFSRKSGNADDVEGYHRFQKSDYYYKIPNIDIKSKLMAKMITGDREIDTGDSYDINHASHTIPYADIFITDRFMKHQINSLAIDELYNCKVLYSGDIDEIEAII